MTREIKFRAWDGEKMTSAIRLEFAHGLRLVSTDDLGFGMIGDDKCILMQFTGLTDHHGKDIYEGDIVNIYRQTDYMEPEDEDEEDGTPKNHWNMENAFVCKQEVKWNEYGGYSCDEDTGEYCPLLGDSDDIVVEIIGNIYQNPELLK